MTGSERPQVFFVGGGRSDTRCVVPESVGGKAYNLMRMDRIGLSVPPAFVLSTGYCREYFATGKLPADFAGLLRAHVRELENLTGRAFGSTRRPLLVSVRSAAPFSMPGMLSTVLDVGLNERVVHGLIRMTGNPRLAWDSYRRLIASYAENVAGLDGGDFAKLVREAVAASGVHAARELDAAALRSLSRASLDLYRGRSGRTFPGEPIDQLLAAVEAVLRSWRAPRAVEYRAAGGLDPEIGTAVIVQPMVFGNAGLASGSGVVFTRDPATGENRMVVEYQRNAQGEDVVAGREVLAGGDLPEPALSAIGAELERAKASLEAEFRDMQDFEFTVEEGRLYLLQTRSGKRTPWAALRIAVDLVAEGLVDATTALGRLAAHDLDGLSRMRFRAAPAGDLLAMATPSGIGVAVGAVALDAERAIELQRHGETVILVREEILTEDVRGIRAAAGVISAAGGRTSHAAVVALELGTVCLVGCPGLRIDASARRLVLGGREIKEGDVLSLDGETGEVFLGRLEVVRETPVRELAEVARWRSAAAAG